MKNISISITDIQKAFIHNHPEFNVSKFFRLILNEYMELTKQNGENYGKNKV